MSPRWKATMPKELPPADMSHFVFAVKTNTGERLELTGKAMTSDVVISLRNLQDAIQKAKEQA
jgi:hypothetical protein